ncbi:hypothetical protein (Partial), partial [Seminavis robusta]|eukprot:Sro4150_g353180.1 n/a (280) ;mRNA; r:2-841
MRRPLQSHASCTELTESTFVRAPSPVPGMSSFHRATSSNPYRRRGGSSSLASRGSQFEGRILARHMIGNDECSCLSCRDRRGELTREVRNAVAALVVPSVIDVDAPDETAHPGAPSREASAPAARVPVPPTPVRRCTEDAVMVVSPSPRTRSKRGASSITMPCYQSRQSPHGLFRQGYNGPDSVLCPRLYGDIGHENRAVVDKLVVVSGSYKFSRPTVFDAGSSSEPGSLRARAATEEDDALRALNDLGLDVQGVTTGVAQFISPVVEQCFLPTMTSIGV